MIYNKGSKIKTSNTTRNTIYLIAVFFLIRLIIASTTGLGTGESYYFRGAHTIALSYVDQPPLFFWLSHASLSLFGTNTFGLRLPDVMLFSGTSFMLYLISRWFFS